MIVDAGGGTVDLTTYKFVTADPIAVEETAAPGCTSVNASSYGPGPETTITCI